MDHVKFVEVKGCLPQIWSILEYFASSNWAFSLSSRVALDSMQHVSLYILTIVLFFYFQKHLLCSPGHISTVVEEHYFLNVTLSQIRYSFLFFFRFGYELERNWIMKIGMVVIIVIYFYLNRHDHLTIFC